MNSIRVVCFFLSLFLVQFSFAQKKKAPKLSKADNATVTNLQAHISYLATISLKEEEPVLTEKNWR
jgi:hypothetical protein